MKFISKSRLAIVSLVYALLLLGCWKDTDVFKPYAEPEYFDVDDLFKTWRQEQIKKVSGHTGQAFYFITPGRTILTVPANSLVLPSGADCQCPMTFEYLEAYSKGDLLAFGIPTVAKGGRLLESGGELFIQFKSLDGQILKIKPGGKVKLQVQVQDGGQIDPDMQFFNLGADSTWVLDTTVAVNGREWSIRDSLQGWGFGYECFPKELQWINIDKFVDVPEDQKTPVCVDLPDNYNAENTAVFMVFKDLNSVVSLNWTDQEKLFCEPYGKVPLGFNVTFVVISRQGEEEYHLATSTTVITKDHHEDMFPKKATLEDIKEIIKNL